MTTLIKRLYNWCRRFRHRCGYGVHSPSDFFLITSVIYEKYPYYAYEKLANLVEPVGNEYRIKVYKLLFRLINYYTPTSIIDIGGDRGKSLAYMKAASNKMTCYSCVNTEDKDIIAEVATILGNLPKIDCMHIGFTPYYKELFDMALEHVDNKSIIIVGNIYSSAEKREWWEQVKNDQRTVITFDLYDIGIILFTEKRYKQNYIVNFL